MLDFIYDCKRRQRNILERLDTLIRLASPLQILQIFHQHQQIFHQQQQNIPPTQQIFQHQLIFQHQQIFQLPQQNIPTNIPPTSTNITSTTTNIPTTTKYSTNTTSISTSTNIPTNIPPTQQIFQHQQIFQQPQQNIPTNIPTSTKYSNKYSNNNNKLHHVLFIHKPVTDKARTFKNVYLEKKVDLGFLQMIPSQYNAIYKFSPYV